MTNSKVEQNLGSEQHAVPFPLQLFKAIEFGDREIMDWVSQGKAFSIKNAERFVDEVCQPILCFSRFESFLQCLHLHGFRKLILRPDFTAYYHPCFRRRDPDQLCRIKPVHPQQTNFYEKTIASFLSNPSAILNSSSPRSTSPRASNRVIQRNSTRPTPPPVISLHNLHSLHNTINHAYNDSNNDDHSETSFGAANINVSTRKPLSVISLIGNLHSSKKFNTAQSTDLPVTPISSHSTRSEHTSMANSPKSPDSDASLKSSFNSPLSPDTHTTYNSFLNNNSHDSYDSHRDDCTNTPYSTKSNSCPPLTLHSALESTSSECNTSKKRSHNVTFSPSNKDLQISVVTSSKRLKLECQTGQYRANATANPIETQAKLYLDVDTSLVESYGDIYYRLNDGTFLCVPADCALTPTTTINLIKDVRSCNDDSNARSTSELTTTFVDHTDSTFSTTNDKVIKAESQSSNQLQSQSSKARSLSISEPEFPSSFTTVNSHTDTIAVNATLVGTTTNDLSNVNSPSIQEIKEKGSGSEASSNDVYDHFASIFDFSLGSSSYDLFNSCAI